jgi:hypothetical protein
MRDKITQRTFEIYVILVFIWIIFASLLDFAMIILHFIYPELAKELLDKIKLW